MKLPKQDPDTQTWISIHKALHNPKCWNISIQGKELQIQLAMNQCRYVRLNNINYMVQNPNKKGYYAERARKGEQLTWVMRDGPWGLIANNTVEKQ